MSRSPLLRRLATGSLATALATFRVTATFMTAANAGTITNLRPPFAFTNTVTEVTFDTAQGFISPDSTVLHSNDLSIPPSACPASGCSANQTEIGGSLFVDRTDAENVDGDKTW